MANHLSFPSNDGFKNALNEAQEKVSQLNDVSHILSEIVLAGKKVTHKKYGNGIITSIDDGLFTVNFNATGEKEMGINLSMRTA